MFRSMLGCLGLASRVRKELSSAQNMRKHCTCALGRTWAPQVRSNGSLGRHLGVQGRSNGPLGRHWGAQGRSNGPLGRHLGAQGRSNGPLGRHLRTQEHSNGLRARSHCAFAARSHSCARSAQIPVLLCCAPGALLERTSNPLCVCSRCSKSLFKIAVRESCLGITVLRFTSLCFTHTGMYMPGSH